LSVGVEHRAHCTFTRASATRVLFGCQIRLYIALVLFILLAAACIELYERFTAAIAMHNEAGAVGKRGHDDMTFHGWRQTCEVLVADRPGK
jgi:hypothetical protein